MADDAPSLVPSPPDSQRLERVLGLVAMISIVVGEVIGSGIFFMPADVARHTGGYVGVILSLWVVCGLINLCGALAMAELSTMYPQAGGTYVFLRETYGHLCAFLWAWAEFWVIRTGAIATLAVFTAIAVVNVADGFGYLEPGKHQQAIAVATILLLGTINTVRTLWGSSVQVVTTAIKAGFVAFLAVLPFVAVRNDSFDLGPLWPPGVEPSMIASIGAALAAIMWAYDGWGNATVVAEEVRNPSRTVPMALIIGVVLLVILYTGANLAYHLTLPSAEIAAAPIPAIAVCQKLMPVYGTQLMQSMLLVSLFGALNGNILVGPRVVFAAARDNRFLGPLGHIHPVTRTPALATAVMCAWAIALVALAGYSPDPNRALYEVLIEWTIFGGSIFYLLAVVAVFILRARMPEAPRPYRTWGYPVVPAIFVLFYIGLLASLFWAQPKDRLIGLVLIGLGMVPYFAFRGRDR